MHLGPSGPAGPDARLFVLAAGGIENARLLLLAHHLHGSRPTSPAWSAAASWSIRATSACRLVPADPTAVRSMPGSTTSTAARMGIVMGRLMFTDEARRRAAARGHVDHRLQPLSTPAPVVAGGVAANAGAGGRAEQPAQRLVIGGVGTPSTVRRLRAARSTSSRRPIPRTGSPSAIGRDRFGSSDGRRFHWRWRALDQREPGPDPMPTVAGELERHGLGRVEIAAGTPFRIPTPTTTWERRACIEEPAPAASWARQGRVHGVSNLFVAGSSVFPTSGFANPTLKSLGMIKNYFKIAWRNLVKNKASSFINIGGLQ